ncbi:PEP-CTERM sorting domain-containing protein [Coraliomargarita algicola]|uniref:PEP-CTERM sorting domain-containing protein n=1 Tax=Coraliomargarita algicola TaxID=3092156 RepID=A0ABZ0RPE4_9BACT|nr:PEP-CTERM sorting domain-containing protein [Coraliomargarita sp. J2-16]WPJ97278.1 PEP-CTERM sorting domain-containing protein [Coraliomargarita sp. J2-16]
MINKINIRYALAAATCLIGFTLNAAPVTMVGSNSFGESWLTGGDWSDGNAATSGNDYTVGSAFTVRTVQAPSTTFQGDSLTVEGILSHKAVSSTIGNLILSGGTVSNQGYGSANVTMTLNGGITLTSATTSTFEAGPQAGRNLVFASAISGEGNIDITSLVAGNSVTLSNASNSFTGTITVQSGGLLDFDYAHDTAASLSIVSGGLLNLDENLSFSGLNLLGDTIGAGTYSVADFTALDANYTALFNDGGGMISVIPEPSAFALVGGACVFGLVVMRRRRS